MFGRRRIRSLSEESEPKERILTPAESKFLRTCALTERLHGVVLAQADDIRTLLRSNKKGDMSDKIAKATVTYKAVAEETREMEEAYLKTYPSGQRLFNHDEDAKRAFQDWVDSSPHPVHDPTTRYSRKQFPVKWRGLVVRTRGKSYKKHSRTSAFFSFLGIC